MFAFFTDFPPPRIPRVGHFTKELCSRRSHILSTHPGTDASDFLFNAGHDLRGYVYALDGVLDSDTSVTGGDRPFTDAIGILIRRIEGIADGLIEKGVGSNR